MSLIDDVTHKIQVKVSEIVEVEGKLIDDAIFGHIQRIADEEGIKIDVQLNRDFIIKALQNRQENIVKHGKWLDNGERTIGGSIAPFAISCSVCGSSQGTTWMNYCPHCGARMDGDSE